jgi:hypothetical protein
VLKHGHCREYGGKSQVVRPTSGFECRDHRLFDRCTPGCSIRTVPNARRHEWHAIAEEEAPGILAHEMGEGASIGQGWKSPQSAELRPGRADRRDDSRPHEKAGTHGSQQLRRGTLYGLHIGGRVGAPEYAPITHGDDSHSTRGDTEPDSDRHGQTLC